MHGFNLKLYSVFIVLLFCSFFNSLFADEICNSPWKIGVYDNPPFQSYINEKAEGLETDIIIEVAKRLKCQVTFTKIPWVRQFYEAQQGKVDIIMGAGKRKDREEYLYYLKPYKNLPSVIVFLNKPNAPKSFVLSDLKNMNITVGALIGAMYSDEYEQLIKEPAFSSKIKLTSKDELNIQKLKLGRLDAVLFTGILEVKNKMKTEYNNKELIIYPVSPNDFGYFTYSKKTFTLNSAEKIDTTIQKMQSEGTLRKLMEKYFSQYEIKSISVAN